jgi:acetyltransferase-like isoleucine patch superfamily enzyme
VSTAGSESPQNREIPRAQEQLFRPGSAVDKYRALIIGQPGWWPLLRFELVMLLGQHLPGALGLALRKVTYPWLLGRCGRNVVFGQGVVLRHPHKIRIGDNVVIDDHCMLDAKGERNVGITIGSGVFIGRNTILSCKDGDIELGDEANIGFNCEIFSASRVTVGAGTLLAAYAYLIGGDHDASDRVVGVLAQGRRSRGIHVGAGAWLGARVSVLDGASIGDRAVVGAHAVVRGDVPDGATAVGVPARILPSRS